MSNTNAIRDQNHIPVKLGVLNTDGVTLVPIAINPVGNGMKITTIDTISFTMTPIDSEDDNFVDAILCEGDDGLTYPLVVNSSGAVLIDM